jgi:Uma2 family endonuclease
MPQATRLVTAEEFEHFSEDEAYRVELVRGRLVRMSPVAFRHGQVVVQLIVLLSRYLDEHPVGVILPDVGFKLQSDPDTVRGPDVAFVLQERVAELDRPGFVRGAPDLVFEVLSPEDRPHDIRERLDDYFGAGVRVVVIVDPQKKSATIHRASSRAVVLRGDDAVLEIGQPLPGFTCTLAEIFK